MTLTLVTVAGGHQLAPAAAAAYLRARAAGAPAGITSSYRTRAEQEVLYAKWLAGTGASAAVPGTSVHEKGRALDLPDEDENPRAWPRWAEFGWVRTNDEPWHREYRASADQHLTDAPPAPAEPTRKDDFDMATLQELHDTLVGVLRAPEFERPTGRDQIFDTISRWYVDLLGRPGTPDEIAPRVGAVYDHGGTLADQYAAIYDSGEAVAHRQKG